MGTQRSGGHPVRGRFDALALVPAVAYGLMAGLAVYLLMVLYLAVEVYALSETGMATLAGRPFLFGTLGDYYTSHLGTTSGLALGIDGVDTIPALIYYLSPPVVLVVAGLRSAQNSKAADSARRTAIQGSAIVVGYLLAVLLTLGAFVSLVSLSLVGLDPVRIAFVAGVVYPLAFGGLGGYLHHVEQARRDRQR